MQRFIFLILIILTVTGCSTRPGYRQASHNENPTTVAIPPGIDRAYALELTQYTLARRGWAVVPNDGQPVVTGTLDGRGVDGRLVLTVGHDRVTIIDESTDKSDGDPIHVLAWLEKVEADLKKNFNRAVKLTGTAPLAFPRPAARR